MLNRIPLTLKALLATALVATATWSLLDIIQTDHLRTIFQSRISSVLGEKASVNRIFFDNHIRAYHQTVRLLTAQRNFLDYLPNLTGTTATNKTIHHDHLPPWLPRASVLRGFTPIPILLLLGPDGLVREIYQGQTETPPKELLEPTPLLMELSHNQTFLTAISGTPFLITSETVQDKQGEPLATLMLAAPLNDEFLSRLQGPVGRYTGLVALLEGENQKIIASNQPDTLRSGILLDQTKDKFLVSGYSFFDYGSSDLLLQLVTLESTEALESLVRSILSTERRQRFITAAALIISCLLIMVWITRNIAQITKDIVDFSRNVLDSKTQETWESKDELQMLRNRFLHLTKKIITTRDTLETELEERKRAENAMRKFSHAVEQSPVAVMITNPQGHIEYINPQFTVLTGYTASETIGRDPGFLKSGTTPPATYKTLWETISAGQVWRGELHNRRKDGTTYWELNAISTIHDPDQNTTHYIAIKEDVSLRIEMEKTLEQAREAAEAAVHIKNDFMANISHELRTPLSTIVGCANQVLEKTCGELNKTQRKYLKEVLSGADRLAGMIDDLLNISKVDTEQFILENQVFELRGLVEGAAAIIETEALAKSLEFTWHVTPEAPGRLLGDPVRLRHALLHLLGNAIKFTPKGRITLTVDRVPPPATPGTILITIADTGIGIPEAMYHTIFDPFTQADSSLSRPYEGSGIGLAITKRFIELMGGTIQVSSKVNEGSVFIVTLPLEIPEPHPQIVDESTLTMACALPGRKALVAGKHPVNRLILKKLLIARDIEVIEAGQCHAVENMTDENGHTIFDLICLDCSNSPSGGVDETRFLRSMPGMESPPILLFGSDDLREKTKDISGLFILPKPIRRSQVYDAINLALNIPESAHLEGMGTE
ncbi:MAG: PAS domain S-box protein [Magnetococcales bacterium]|nr:PAS domain S-box protein [Magnetococcales bacterium]